MVERLGTDVPPQKERIPLYLENMRLLRVFHSLWKISDSNDGIPVDPGAVKAISSPEDDEFSARALLVFPAERRGNPAQGVAPWRRFEGVLP